MCLLKVEILKINLKEMNKVIKEFLTNKAIRNKTSLFALIAAVLVPGQPWF
jgi:hypothetical protein